MRNAKLSSIQYLRCLAACVVLTGHVFMESHTYGLIPDSAYRLIDIYPWGFGVDIFFIVSGFIIYDVMSRLPPTAGAVTDFIVKRLIRIVPVYWVFTLLMVGVMLTLGSHIDSNVLSLPHLFASLAFVPWPEPISGHVKPVLGQGWTLNYEMFFYVIAAIAVFLRQDRRLHFITATIIILFLTSSLLYEASTWHRFLSYSVLLEFLIGIWICHYLSYVRDLSLPIRLAMGVAGLCLLVPAKFLGDVPRVLTHGLPSALIFLAMLRPNSNLQTGVGRLAERVGDASYSLYLSHPFVINGLWLLGGSFFRGNAIVFGAFSFLASVTFAILFHQLIEVRLLSFLQGRWARETGWIRAPQSA